jgi:hypothetical protein
MDKVAALPPAFGVPRREVEEAFDHASILSWGVF